MEVTTATFFLPPEEACDQLSLNQPAGIQCDGVGLRIDEGHESRGYKSNPQEVSAVGSGTHRLVTIERVTDDEPIVESVAANRDHNPRRTRAPCYRSGAVLQ